MSVVKFESPLGSEIESTLAHLKGPAFRAGISESVVEFYKTIDSLVLCELAYRKGRIAEKRKKAELKEKHVKKEKQLHEKSIVQIDKTLKILRKERKKHDKTRLKELDDQIKNPSEFQKFREASTEAAQSALLDSNTEPNIAMEILEKHDILLDTVLKEHGYSGLLDHVEEKLEELKNVRSTRPNRGRDEYNDDINWWKVIIVVGALCVSVGCGIACASAATVTLPFVTPFISVPLFIACLSATVGITLGFAALLVAVFC